MRNCTNCQMPLVNGAKFCGNCGAVAPTQHATHSSQHHRPTPTELHAQTEASADPHAPQYASAPGAWVQSSTDDPAASAPRPSGQSPQALPHYPGTANSTLPPQQQPEQESEKDFLTAYLLSFFLGGLAIDRFYLGYGLLGLLKLAANLLTVNVWYFVDLFLLAYGNLKDPQGLPLKDYQKHRTLAIALSFVAVGLAVLVIVGAIIFILAVIASVDTSN